MCACVCVYVCHGVCTHLVSRRKPKNRVVLRVFRSSLFCSREAIVRQCHQRTKARVTPLDRTKHESSLSNCRCKTDQFNRLTRTTDGYFNVHQVKHEAFHQGEKLNVLLQQSTVLIHYSSLILLLGIREVLGKKMNWNEWRRQKLGRQESVSRRSMQS